MAKNQWYIPLVVGGAACLVVLPGMVTALPELAEIRFGSVDVKQSGGTMTVKQGGDRAVLNWSRFDVGQGEHVRFEQPSANSAILNRVHDSGASHIDGALSANGQVYISNPGGIVFGKGAHVNVGSLVATTADIGDHEFAKGGALHFDRPGNSGAAVINNGAISVKEGGLAALVAPNVSNSGVISAKSGTVALAAGDMVTVDLYGDDLLSVAVSDKVKKASVSNSGILTAQSGGRVMLTTAQAASVIDSAINMDGVVDASSATEVGGEIIFGGENAVITIGEQARIHASGATGGGTVYVGGQAHGAGPLPNAKTVTVKKGVTVDASATVAGDGGEVIVWSDEKTTMAGNIVARGGEQGGNGGFVEVSGKKTLEMAGDADLRAPKGEKGELLLDPADITIYGNVDPAFASTDGTVNMGTDLVLWLDGADTSKIQLTYSTNGVTTTASGTVGTHTITTAANVSSALYPGGRIRLLAAGGASAASVMGADTYTIASVSGTTITTVEALTQTYGAGTSIYRGLVSEWTDKSTFANTATQSTQADMPVFIAGGTGTGMNGRSILRFDGVSDMMSIADADSLDNTSGLSFFITYIQSVTNGTGSGLLSKRVSTAAADYSYTFYGSTSNSLTVDIVTNNNRFSTPTSTANGTARYYGVVYDGSLSSANRVKAYLYGNLDDTRTEATAFIPNYSSSACVGMLCGNVSTFMEGTMSELFLYRSAVPQLYRHLLDQYQSGKWNVAITPPGTGATEIAKATAADGYNAFTTRYLERLSQSANISLQATNNITLDLKNDTLNISTAGRSLTLSAGNAITSASAGTISTNAGNVTMTATAGELNLGNVTLNAPGGAVQLTSGGAMTLGGITAASILARTTDAAADITLGDALSATGAGDAIILASGDDFINNAGASALSATTGRWLIYSQRAADNTLGSLSGFSSQYSCVYGACVVTAGGNGMLFSIAAPVTNSSWSSPPPAATPVPAPNTETVPLPPVVSTSTPVIPPVVKTVAPTKLPAANNNMPEVARITDVALRNTTEITSNSRPRDEDKKESFAYSKEDMPGAPAHEGEALLTYTPEQLKQLNCKQDGADASCIGVTGGF